MGRLRDGVRGVRGDASLVRRVAYGAAAGAGLVSLVVSVASEPQTPALWAGLLAIVGVVLALPSRHLRSTVLAVVAGFVALFVPDAVFLWPVVSALVFGSVAEDLSPPWRGWVGGLAGAAGSLFLAGADPSLAPFLAVLLGGSAGALLRSRMRAGELVREAEELRGQALWLEQRRSLARELHDILGHHVTAMVVTAEAGQFGDPRVALREIGELGRRALGQLDGLVVHLRDPESELVVTAPPRPADIEDLLAATLRGQGIEVDVRVDPDLGLGEHGVLAVYRIVQEALTNVTRHAQASHVWVEVVRAEDGVRVRVADDGVGPPDRPGRGAGLVGIGERVAGLRGTWRFGERPGGGAVVDVWVPVP
jgi:signal transduction histidine kinase